MTARERLAGRPILAFVILAFGISYALGLPWLIAVSAAAGSRPFVTMYLGRLLVVAGPALAALAMSAATAGKPGVRELLARFRLVPRLLPWCLLLPVLTLGLSLAAYLAAGSPPSLLARLLARGWPGLLAHLALQALVIGALEETGWRGWLLPRLLRRHAPLPAAAILAGIWGCWHLPVLLSGLATAALFLGLVLALSILLTGLSGRVSGNLAVLAIAHGSFNAPINFLEPLAPTLAPAAWSWLVAFYALAAVIVLAVTWKWWVEAPAADERASENNAGRMQKSPGT